MVTRFEITEEEFPIRESETGEYCFYDDYLDLESQLATYKANHADMVKRNAALRDRPDIPSERVQAVQVLVDDNEKLRIEIATYKADKDEAAMVIASLEKDNARFEVDNEKLKDSIKFKNQVIRDLQNKSSAAF